MSLGLFISGYNVSMKTCTNPDCKQVNPQPLEAFEKVKDTQGGYRAECKACRNTKRRGKTVEQKEKWNAYMRKWNKEHKDSKTYKEKYKNKSLKFRYGITLEQQKQIAITQDNKCPICDKVKRLVSDHDHETGKFRALLCFTCNRSMHLLDTPGLLDKALVYKQKHQ